MIPIGSIILFLISLFYIIKHGPGYVSLFLFMASLFLMLCYFVGSYFMGVEFLSSTVNPKIVDYLDNNPVGQGRIFFVDYLNKELADSIIKSGNEIGTHHSWSNKVTNDSLFSPLISVIYKIPTINSFFVNISQTQKLTLSEQLKLGVKYMDIRISLRGGILYVDHGVIFGKFDDFIEEFEKAIDETGADCKVLYSNSSYNNKDFNISDYLDTNDLKYRDLFRLNSSFYDSVYLNTESASDVIDLLKTNQEDNLQLLLTPNVYTTIAVMTSLVVLTLILTFITLKLVYRIKVNKRRNKTTQLSSLIRATGIKHKYIRVG